jgi:two-component system, NtrC family, sensor kinase
MNPTNLTNLLDDDIIILEEDDIETFLSPETKLPTSINQSLSKLEKQGKVWKILVVDDDIQVHHTTKIVLKDFTFDGKSLILISAYSAKEAQEIIKTNPDIALIFLDVVMEYNDAGLQVVKYIRETLNNNFVRIILRTGQPGEAPEESIIVNYDINDYTLKTELTYQRLTTIVIASLRSYNNIINTALKTEELDKLLRELQASQESLQQTQKERDRFFTLSPDMLATAGFDGYFKLVNPAFEKILGYTSQEIQAKPFIEFVHPDDREATIAEAAKLGEGGDTVSFENRYSCKDGSYCWLSWIAKGSVEEELIYANVRDITERKQTEARFQTQYSVTQILSESTSQDKAIPEILRTICQNLDWELGEFWAIDTQAKVLRCNYSWPKSPLQLSNFITITQDYSFPCGVGLPGRVWMTGKPAWIMDVVEDGNFLRSNSAAASGLHTAFGFPVFNEDNISGVIVFFTKTIQHPNESLLTLMLNIGSQIGQFIVRKQAEKALQEFTIQLQQQAERERLINQKLEKAFNELQQTQGQLVQNEKMSSLGKLVAGIAHEINNPVTFIHGNITYAQDYIEDVLKLLNLYQIYYPNPEEIIQTTMEQLDLDFLIKDLSKLFESMKTGTERIRQIVFSLRTFSRLDEAEFKTVNIHEGIDSTLVILQHRLHLTDKRPAITVKKNYGDLPKIDCFAGHMNQVFMNIFNNAIDALEENGAKNPTIWVETEKINANEIAIRIRDNGIGICPSVKPRIFDPFFTTKPIGQGTGMGLATSYQIITQKHGGKLECNSTLGKGTEFVITIPVHQPGL